MDRSRNNSVFFRFFTFGALFLIVTTQNGCPRAASRPEIVGVLTTGGTNGHPVRITVNFRSREAVTLEWQRSVPSLQAYNYTALYRVPIQDDRQFTITTTKRGTSYHTSLQHRQPDPQKATDFSLYHLKITVTCPCFQYELTVTPPIGGANGAGIIMPQLFEMEGKATTTRESELNLSLKPVIPREVMTAIREGLINEKGDDYFYLHMSPWKEHWKPNGTNLDWYGPLDVPDKVRHVLRYGGYPTGPYISTRPMDVTTPGLYMATFTQVFLGMKLELTVLSKVTQADDIPNVYEGAPPSVGLATCATYSWRNSTFGDVIPLRKGEANCVRCIGSSASSLRMTFAKHSFLADGTAGYTRLPVDEARQLVDYTSVRYNIKTPESAVGWYVCGATNHYGTTTRTFRIDVIDPIKMLRVEPSVMVLQEDGQEITMKCSARGTPLLNITFYRMDLDMYRKFQNEPFSSLRYRAFPLDSRRGDPPMNTVVTTRSGTTVTAELKHRISRFRYYRQGEQFACVARNAYGDFRIGVATIVWRPA